MDGLLPTTNQDELSIGLAAEAVAAEAEQVVGQEMVGLVTTEYFDGGRNLLDVEHLARRYGESQERMQRLVESGIFPLPILKINGVTPVWLAAETDDWNDHRFGTRY